MIIHDSKAKKEGWISVDESLPLPHNRVEICCVNIMDWNLENTIWKSEGHLTKRGIWSVKASETATKEKVFSYKTTHWRWKDTK